MVLFAGKRFRASSALKGKWGEQIFGVASSA
jgi:hypothetical protein